MVELQGQTYKKLLFEVIPNLCADVILRLSFFLNEHSKVLLKLEGTHKCLVINNKIYCGVFALNFEGCRLFQKSLTQPQANCNKVKKV